MKVKDVRFTRAMIIVETEKAYLFRNPHQWEVWLPKSQVRWVPDEDPGPREGEPIVRVPRWLGEKECDLYDRDDVDPTKPWAWDDEDSFHYDIFSHHT
jgi:hypothetical protein